VSKVTIYDIAREAGVSVATVSRILTGSAPVSQALRQKVEGILEKHSFRPNRVARNLTYQRSMMIGVILPDITNPFFSTVFAEIQRRALEQDYSILLFNAMNSLDLESEGLAYLSHHQVDGLIFMGGRVNEIALSDVLRDELTEFAAKVPTLIVNGGIQSKLVSTVRTDEAGGIAQLIDYLSGLGHERIGMVGGSDHITVTRDRQSAFRDAMARCGHSVREDWLIASGFSIESGVEVAGRLFERPEIPTAVICINDLVALGVLKAARQHRIEVPENLSVAGFDDIYLAEVSTPELTTVSHDYPALGRAIIEKLLGRIQNEDLPETTQIEMQLVVRNSCHPPAN
jgi:DNA-binding LacI/PurR family transcriptional regulator